jgi:hypothetical protein
MNKYRKNGLTLTQIRVIPYIRRPKTRCMTQCYDASRQCRENYDNAITDCFFMGDGDPECLARAEAGKRECDRRENNCIANCSLVLE